MPFSDKQREAVRRNGLKSRGPVTERGKAASSRNSLRHGLLANTVVLDCESPDRFLSLVSALRREFQPESEVERALVETMAVCRWRQMRLWGMEKAGLAFEIRKQTESPDQNPAIDPATQAALAFQSLCHDSRAYEVMNRYESRFDRQYDRALERLTELRRNRDNFPASAWSVSACLTGRLSGSLWRNPMTGVSLARA